MAAASCNWFVEVSWKLCGAFWLVSCSSSRVRRCSSCEAGRLGAASPGWFLPCCPAESADDRPRKPLTLVVRQELDADEVVMVLIAKMKAFGRSLE